MKDKHLEVTFTDEYQTFTVPLELMHVSKVIDNGAKKHGRGSYLTPEGFPYAKRAQSEFRHLLKKYGLWDNYVQYQKDLADEPFTSYVDGTAKSIKYLLSQFGNVEYKESNQFDEESGLDHDLHSICNAMMSYVRKQRGILKEEPRVTPPID